MFDKIFILKETYVKFTKIVNVGKYANLYLKVNTELEEDLPYGKFTILYYRIDSLSDTEIGCDRILNCETINPLTGDEYNFCFKYPKKDREFFNISELNKIRNLRINKFLNDSGD